MDIINTAAGVAFSIWSNISINSKDCTVYITFSMASLCFSGKASWSSSVDSVCGKPDISIWSYSGMPFCTVESVVWKCTIPTVSSVIRLTCTEEIQLVFLIELPKPFKNLCLKFGKAILNNRTILNFYNLLIIYTYNKALCHSSIHTVDRYWLIHYFFYWNTENIQQSKFKFKHHLAELNQQWTLHDSCIFVRLKLNY